MSKILWHFTGGPKWNDKSKKQEIRPKSVAAAYKALTGILRDKTLKLGGYKEVVNVVLPRHIEYDKKTKEHAFLFNVPKQIVSSPVCCVADIPVMHLSYHARRYGKIAIGFHRRSILHAGFSPVFYQIHDADTVVAFQRAVTALHKDLLAPLEYYLADGVDEIDSRMREDAEKFHYAGLDASTSVGQELYLVSKAIEDVRVAFKIYSAFIKTMSGEELETIYTEREWRAVSPYRFSYSDVAMIVLPKSEGRKSCFDRFVNESEAIGIPRSIPIVAWEDLIEH